MDNKTVNEITSSASQGAPKITLQPENAILKEVYITLEKGNKTLMKLH